jgi:hypothetical protein
MNEKDSVENPEPKPQVEGVTFEELVDDAVSLVEALGKAVVTTAQDVSQLMVVRTDAEMRERLDLLVEAGVVKNRRAGARAMIEEGIEAKQPLFEQIERTQERIAALKGQLRSLVTVNVGE